MDGSSKIALGVVAAAMLLLVGFIGYREFERQRDIAQAQAVMQGISDYAQQALRDSHRQEVQRQRQYAAQRAFDARQRIEQQQRSLDARRLAPDEQCVGGSVVRIDGPSYTQVAGGNGRPVACAGRFRLL